jgi:hypothetical protein
LEGSEVELDGKGPPELRITSYSDRGFCCETDYYFSRDGGAVKNVLIIHGGQDLLTEEKDLNGDGRMEIWVNDASLAYLGGLGYFQTPYLPRVIGWDGRSYVEMTRRYRSSTWAELIESRNEMWNDRYYPSEWERRSYALTYYANAFVLGREAIALAWIRRHAPPSTFNWLAHNLPEARRRLSAFPRRIMTSQKKALGGWK